MFRQATSGEWLHDPCTASMRDGLQPSVLRLVRCPSRRYETMIVLRPDLSDDDRCAAAAACKLWLQEQSSCCRRRLAIFHCDFATAALSDVFMSSALSAAGMWSWPSSRHSCRSRVVRVSMPWSEGGSG